MVMTFLRNAFPLSPYHSISLGLLQSWASELKVLLEEALVYLDDPELKNKADAKETLVLQRLTILIEEWLGVSCPILEDDKDLLNEDLRLKNVLTDIDLLDDKFTLYHYRDSYLIMTGVARKLSKLTYLDGVNSTEVSAYILGRMYSPLDVDLSSISNDIDYSQIFKECHTDISAMTIYKVTRFFRIYYYYVEHGVPMPPMTLLHSAGCVLLSLYRLTALLTRISRKDIYDHLSDIFAHLTTGVPHVHQETSTSGIAFPGPRILTEERRRNYRSTIEDLKTDLYTS